MPTKCTWLCSTFICFRWIMREWSRKYTMSARVITTKRTGCGKLKASLLSVGYTLGGTRVHVMDSHMEKQTMWLPAVSSTWRGRIGNLTLQVNQSWDHIYIKLKADYGETEGYVQKTRVKAHRSLLARLRGHCKLRMAGMLAFLWNKEHVRYVIQL